MHLVPYLLCFLGQELLAKAENFFHSLAGISLEEISSLDNFSDQAHILDNLCYCKVSHHDQPGSTDLMRLLFLYMQDPRHTLMSHPVDDDKENTTRSTPKRGFPLTRVDDDVDDDALYDDDDEGHMPLNDRMTNMALDTPTGRAGTKKSAKKAFKPLTPQQMQKLK